MPYSKQTRYDICMRLGPNWSDLSILMGVPCHERETFAAGDEPRRLWEWLERRGGLSQLPDLLRQIGRPDLSEIMDRDPGRHHNARHIKRETLTLGCIVIAALALGWITWNVARHASRHDSQPLQPSRPHNGRFAASSGYSNSRRVETMRRCPKWRSTTRRAPTNSSTG